MDIKGSKRMLLDEKMSDKNDPKHEGCYKRDVDVERHFTRATRISRAMAKVQGFTSAHQTLFLVIVFGFATYGLIWNIYRPAVVYYHHPVRRMATEMRDLVLRERHKMLFVPHVRRFDMKESGTERSE